MAVKVQVRTEAELKALERAQKELDEMRKKVVTSGKAVEEMTKDLRKLDTMQRTLNKTTGDTSTKMGGLSGYFNGLTITAGDVANGLRTAGEAIWDVASAGAEAQRATDTLRFAVERAGISWNENADAIDANIQKLSYLAAVDDEDLYVAQSKLMRSTGDLAESQKLLGLATDISALTGKDLEAVTKALGQAYNGNYGALKKLGVAIGDVSSSTEAMGILYDQFGGGAAYVNDNLVGDSKRLEIAWGNLKEAAGEAFGPTLSRDLDSVALAMQLLSSKTLSGSEKWDVYWKAYGGAKDNLDVVRDALGLNTVQVDRMSDAQARAAQTASDLLTAQQELAGLQVNGEQLAINLARAEQRVADAQKGLADAGISEADALTSTNDAALDYRQSLLDLDDARKKQVDNQAELDAIQRETDALGRLATAAQAAADAKARGYRTSTGVGGIGGLMMAEGGIIAPSVGGTPVIAAEAGVPEAFIPLEPTVRSQSLVAAAAQAVGMSSGPTFDFRGAVFGSGITQAQVQAWMLDALGQVTRSSGYLKV